MGEDSAIDALEMGSRRSLYLRDILRTSEEKESVKGSLSKAAIQAPKQN